MKVCFIAGTLGRGGAERQLFYMLQALQSVQVSARVLSLTKGEAYEKEIEDLGIKVEWIGRSESRIRRLFAIIDNVQKDRADILQSTHFFTNIYAAGAGRVLGIPSIGAIRSDLAFELASNRFYGAWQLKLPKHLICNSSVAIDRTRSRGIFPGRIDLLKNVVDICSPARKTQSQNGKPLCVLFAGRFTREKRPDLFLDLAARLLAESPNSHMRFVLAGDGPLRKDLESSVARNGSRSDRIVFLGDQSDMSKVYETTDILVLTSEHEGTPNVVLEAMAHGIPVVATSVGDVPEILGQERGFMVGPSDLDGLYSATKKLVENEELRVRMGKTGRAYVTENHSLTSLSKRLTDIYSKIRDGELRNG